MRRLTVMEMELLVNPPRQPDPERLAMVQQWRYLKDRGVRVVTIAAMVGVSSDTVHKGLRDPTAFALRNPKKSRRRERV